MYVLYIHSHRELQVLSEGERKGWRYEKDPMPTVDSYGDAGGESPLPVPLNIGADSPIPNRLRRGWQNTRRPHDWTGLWGLPGLAGLRGLTGLGRRREDVRVYSTDPRERTHT